MSLSALTRRPVRVYNIRAGRPRPGLAPQHLLSALSVSRITGGSLTGASIGSKELAFAPGELKPGHYTFDVSEIKASAGSTGLVFQTVAPPLFFAPGRSRLTVKGGTHVEWSPSADYIKDVFLPLISRMGIVADLQNPIKGYYPVGGGEIHSTILPVKEPLSPLVITERGPLVRVTVYSTVSNLPALIAKRQLDRVLMRLEGLPLHPACRTDECPSPGKGTFVFILAEFENILAAFSALGAIGKKAETVADEAADRFLSYYNKTGALDPHLSDQAAPFMAFADGESTVTVSEVTEHLLTNIHVIESFLPVKFSLEGGLGEEGRLTVTGCALRAA